MSTVIHMFSMCQNQAQNGWMLASLPPQERTLMTVMISEAPEPPTPWGHFSRALLDLGDDAPQRGQYAYAEGRHLEMTFSLCHGGAISYPFKTLWLQGCTIRVQC